MSGLEDGVTNRGACHAPETGESGAMNAGNYGADQLDAVMINGRYSTLLASQLDFHIRNRILHSHIITDEIAALEGGRRRSQTKGKRGERFRGKWLKGLWHKHFFQPFYMLENLKLYWTEERIKATFGEQMSIDEAIYHFVIGGYAGRAQSKRLTGEYFVFAKQDETAYYLTLAYHKEDDEVVWQRCKACATEFPQLAILQEDRGG
jgi:hypothetical protein